MRWTWTVIFVGIMLMFGAQKANAADDNFSISGKLIYQYEKAACEQCEVVLETSGRPVATVFSDSSGSFTFRNLAAGTYVVKIKLDGYETIEERVEVSSLFPGNILLMLAQNTVSRGNPDSEHVVDVATYLKRYPDKAVELYKNADKNVRKHNRDEAISQLEEAVAIAPDFYPAHNYLGLLYKAADRFDDAEKEFEIAEKLNLTSPEPLINLGGLYIEGNQPDRAVQASEEAIKRDSRSAPAFFNLGLALYRASKFLLAQDALQKALSIAPRMGQARLALANVFMKLQNIVGLREQLTAYLKENPKSPERDTIQQFLSDLPEGQESRQ
jgi:tetratricopeptide (TPR) repeat protein